MFFLIDIATSYRNFVLHINFILNTVDSRYSEVGYSESPDIVNGKKCLHLVQSP